MATLVEPPGQRWLAQPSTESSIALNIGERGRPRHATQLVPSFTLPPSLDHHPSPMRVPHLLRTTFALLCLFAAALADDTLPPYTLPGTEVLATPFTAAGRDYEVFVSLPAGYQPGRRYPVLYLTDANYSFPLVRSISSSITKHGPGLEPFILVGLSYAKDDSPMDSRRRDYTPSDGSRSGDQLAGKHYGEAAAYLNFLKTVVFPQVEQHYGGDPARRIFAGHSFGGLLGLTALFREPTLFSHYIIGSPSLWFDDHELFRLERQYAASHRSLPAKVRLYMGSFEAPGKGPRFDKEGEMVGDMRRFVRQMQSHRYTGLDVAGKVFEEEDHSTVYPLLITRGLLWALPKER
ncbi:alpha/beta hydrolase [Chitinimonas naiadis]